MSWELRYSIKLAAILSGTLFLFSCGGGGGGSSSAASCAATDRLPCDVKTNLLNSTAAKFIDVDGDGDLDLYLGPMWRQTEDMILLNDGSGKFTHAPAGNMPPRYGGSGFGAPSAYSADFDKDGDQDLLLSLTSLDYSQGYLQLLLNNGSGVFTDASGNIPQNLPGRWMHEIRIADFDGDGWMDFITGGTFSTSVNLFRNTGNAVFAKTNIYPNGASVALADINKDGKMDFVSIRNGASQLNVDINNSTPGNIVFAETPSAITLPAMTVIQSSEFVDFNNDTNPDLVFTLYGDGGNPMHEIPTPILAYQNNGAGSFTDVTSTVIPAGSTSILAEYIFAKDFNGDGLTDVFIADNGPHNNAQNVSMPGTHSILLLQNAAGQLVDSSATNLPAGFSGAPHGSTAGDIDGDGDIDVYFANINMAIQTPVFFVNNGAGLFTKEP